MLTHSQPDLILMCCEPDVCASEMDAAPMTPSLDIVPLLLCSRDQTGSKSFNRWKITACITFPAGALPDVIRSWLNMSI